ncbi:Radical SAM superfamily [Megamonas hypermegale ART12/1]|nr:Radical SAM superfamily [Megamonas hypermegale ART12/1]
MIISWNTTNACNMFCDHCYRDAGCKADEELNTQEAKTLLEQIAKAGFKIMIFSGGEPLMRPDIVELVEYATKLGLRSVFGTNGTLITEEMALKLKMLALWAWEFLLIPWMQKSIIISVNSLMLGKALFVV